jgi:hypothetical protein
MVEQTRLQGDGFVDKEALGRIFEEQDAQMGFVKSANVTAQEVRKMMLRDGVRPQDNSASREIISTRNE